MNVNVSDLTLDQKIGQLFMVATVSNKQENEEFMRQTPYTLDPDYVFNMIREHHIGGIIFLGASNPDDQIDLTKAFQSESQTPLLVGQDLEWGLSMRMKKEVITFPKAMTLGALCEADDNLIYELGKEIGEQCKAIGVHINFAPVADVNNNPLNPIINVRSFGEDPQKVAHKSALFMRGLQEAGILACAKHFPGHGDTQTDSHHALPVIPHDKKRLEEIELVPFKHLIKEGVAAVMTAHLSLPKIDDKKPATLSKNIITDLLRNELGFEGLIITDGLGMKGITKDRKPGEVEYKSFLAGNDLLLCPVDVPKAHACIKQAVRTGTISEQELDKRVERILRAKQQANVQSYTRFDKKRLQTGGAWELKEKLYRAAITLAKRGSKIPINNLHQKVPVLMISDNNQETFARKLAGYLTPKKYILPFNTTREQCDALSTQLQSEPVIITSVHIPGRSGMIEAMQDDQTSSAHEYIKLINGQADRTVLVLFGNPYNVKHFRACDTIIVGYENEQEAQKAAADAIGEAFEPRGILPVTVD